VTPAPTCPPVPSGATDPATHRTPSFFHSSAREGFAALLDVVLEGRPDGDRGVLLPAFVGWSPREGSGVFDPVQSSSAEPRFYATQDDLTVDPDIVEGALAAGGVAVLVVIHYFGRTDPSLPRLRALADEHGAVLVEDLAHGFFSARAAGEAGRHGHAALFSLHKMFPLRDGGVLTCRDPQLAVGMTSTRPDLAAALFDVDWRSVADHRRSVWTELVVRLQALPGHGTDFWLPWTSLCDDVPQTLPVVLLHADRDAVYHGMNAEGFGVVSLYHTLIGPVRDAFPAEVLLSTRILNLPVHQDVPVDALPALVECFARHMEAASTTS